MITSTSLVVDPFTDPKNFLPGSIFDYLGGYSATAPVRLPAIIKNEPGDFIVREPLPDYPNQFLTIGSESDFPADDLCDRPHRMVAATLVKEKMTTWGAIDLLSQMLSAQLGREISPNHISNSGLKDRWAITAQTVVIDGVTTEEVRRCRWDYSPGKSGFFLKDIRPAFEKLRNGDHKTNRFNIVVRPYGSMTAGDIWHYLSPRLTRLNALGMLLPNPFGRQRLGRTQDNHLIGRTLVCNDFTAPPDVESFGSASEAAIFRFLFYRSEHEHPDVQRLRQSLQGLWLYNFEEMKERMEHSNYRSLNLSFEHKLINRLADFNRYHGDFEQVIKSMPDEISIWVGAWQAFWWNQVLAHKLPGWSKGLEAGFFDPFNKAIPLLMDTKEAEWYYTRLNYCKKALSELNKADSFVRNLFLTPTDRYGQLVEKGPQRKVFIKLKNFEHYTEDGKWICQFDLRSGAYATTAIEQFWSIVDHLYESELTGEETAEVDTDQPSTAETDSYDNDSYPTDVEEVEQQLSSSTFA